MRRIFGASKTAVISTACIAIAALIIAAVIAVNSNRGDTTSASLPKDSMAATEASAEPQKITPDEAKAIALSEAGFKEEEVRLLKVQRERDDGRLVYEVSFYAGKTEYEYTIDAVSGDIVEYDVDSN